MGLCIEEKVLKSLRFNLAEINPSFKIEPEVCLTLQVESQHTVSHFKHPFMYSSGLRKGFWEQDARIAQVHITMGSLIITLCTDTHICPVPENNVSLRDIPKMLVLPKRKCLDLIKLQCMNRLRSMVRPYAKGRLNKRCITKYRAGTLPLNMYDKELPWGDGYQDSEYDSDSEEKGNDSAGDQGEACRDDLNLDRNAINFLARSIRTRSRRVISLSHKALTSCE